MSKLNLHSKCCLKNDAIPWELIGSNTLNIYMNSIFENPHEASTKLSMNSKDILGHSIPVRVGDYWGWGRGDSCACIWPVN